MGSKLNFKKQHQSNPGPGSYDPYYNSLYDKMGGAMYESLKN